MGTFREFKKKTDSQSDELKAAYAAIAGLSEQVATLTEAIAKVATTSTTGGETK